MKKICFIAPSGYGKSTAIKLLAEICTIKNIKLAEPLYQLQNYFYNFICTNMEGEQDGELLQFFGAKVRKHNQHFLIKKFKDELSKINDKNIIVTNDDCRPPDYKALKRLGFLFVGINGFCRDRIDQTKANPNHMLEWQHAVTCDFYINNFGSMVEYKTELKKLLKNINGNNYEK